MTALSKSEKLFRVVAFNEFVRNKVEKIGVPILEDAIFNRNIREYGIMKGEFNPLFSFG